MLVGLLVFCMGWEFVVGTVGICFCRSVGAFPKIFKIVGVLNLLFWTTVLLLATAII